MTLTDHFAAHPLATLLVLTAVGAVILTLFAAGLETIEPEGTVDPCLVLRCRAL